MKKAPDTMARATAPGAPSKAHFIGKLLDSLNDRACRLIDRATGGDPHKLLNLLAVASFSAGASFALALVGVFK